MTKKKNIPGNATPAPAKKAEKDIKAMRRAHRLRSLMRHGLTKEEILEIFKNEDVRTILCLYYGSFTIEDGTKKKRVVKRDEKHRVVSDETVEVPNVLHGRHAVEKFLEQNKINTISVGPTYCWIKTDKDKADSIVEMLKPIGRTYVYKPEPMTIEKLEEQKKAKHKAGSKTNKKHTNNTTEAKKNAKTDRKKTSVEKVNMRPYYAALRKGSVNTRIKKHNPVLAEKIEKWIKESKEDRAKHRQLTSLEMKANKRARKAAKHLVTQERRRATEKKRAESNAKQRAEHTQKAQKPVQTELKLVA